jgi:hypothetical protein
MWGEPAVVVTLDDAIAEGALVKVREDEWGRLTGGKPIVVSDNVAREIGAEEAFEATFGQYFIWYHYIAPTLPEEQRLFTTRVNGHEVWVIEDGQAFTILFPEDY